MIISASRRTDIPALYMDWFVGRLRAGEALVRNPMRYDQVRRVDLSPENIDGIVFWTKYPAQLPAAAKQLESFPFYVLYTLNPYGADIEPDLPSEEKRIELFRRLAELFGPERMVWRYDPILYTPVYTDSFHMENFTRLANALSGFTTECKTSFVHPYAKIRRALDRIGAVVPTAEQKGCLAARMLDIASGAGITLGACCDSALLEAGLTPAACIDAGNLKRISGKPVRARKDSGQRPGCSCVLSADIGAYDTCTHGCVYCYANHSQAKAAANQAKHDASSPFLLEHSH